MTGVFAPHDHGPVTHPLHSFKGLDDGGNVPGSPPS